VNPPLVQTTFESQAEMVKYYRQRARTDLVFLCNELLGYPDVSWKIHGGLIECLQQFQGGEDDIQQDSKGRVTIKQDGTGYTPFCPKIYDLPGPRNTLMLFARDCLKSTTATIAHSIQWIINYPYIRLLLSTATQAQAEAFLLAIEKHFRSNETFRFFFPEFCPHGNVNEWGNKSEFTCPLKEKLEPKYREATKEPTCRYVTVGSVVSSGHYDVHKNDDLVDKENVRTREQIATVNGHFGMLLPLIQTFQTDRMKPEIFEKYGNTGWRDVVGTRYDFSDLYGTILDDEEKRQVKNWKTYVQSALAKGTSARDRDAVAYWPERLPLSRLISIEDDPFNGPSVAASQYYLSPIPPKSGLVESKDDIVFVPRKVINEILPALRLHVTIDLAGMENNIRGDNDYTVILLAGFGRDGRPYVVNIWRARYGPEEVIDLIFKLHNDYPRIRDFKIQKDHFARVLLPFVEREKARRQRFPFIVPMPINNQVSKQQRILGLKPWFRNKDIRFPEDLSCKQDLIQEIMYFPKYPHDDILDTLADQLQNAEGEHNPDVLPIPVYDPSSQKLPPRIFDKFIGFGANGEPMFSNSQSNNDSLQMTGIL
jgi:predicted phage terminase large subunit-like protein